MNDSSSTTVSSWLRQSTSRLLEAGIETARLDCLVLLEDATKRDRSWLLSYPDYILQIELVNILNTKIAQRCEHVPLAYIRGMVEFYGRDFIVTTNTLVPRPETETMISLLLDLQLTKFTRILDVGTGSGCIAITAALELQVAEIAGCDIDPQCIQVATKNADVLGTNVRFYQADLLDGCEPFDVLLCNLPYVPVTYTLNKAATHEPNHAIFSGTDGLDLYRELFARLATMAYPAYILTESLPEQHATLADIANIAGFTLSKSDDFIQVFQTLAHKATSQ
jgi:release factor glutamine methyltransferase